MLAVIGGTGLYHLDGLDDVKEHDVETPFGKPSSPLLEATLGGQSIFFLPRHGQQHQYLPSEINYRANIFALKQAGVRQILSFSAVGSLREDLKPGDFVMPDQYFDRVMGKREKSFFGQGIVAHVSMAQPTCPNLTAWVQEKIKETDIRLHCSKTYVCVDGPRFGTKAESHAFRQWGCDIVGMTNVPEVFLAREAQICYATIGIVTDYDCWMDDPSEHVSVSKIIERYGESLRKAKNLVHQLARSARPKIDADYRECLKSSVFTPPEAIPKNRQVVLALLQQ